jgi:hypothetical protein
MPDWIGEAACRVKRYLPDREKEGVIGRVVGGICKKEGIEVGEMRMGGKDRRYRGCGGRLHGC